VLVLLYSCGEAALLLAKEKKARTQAKRESLNIPYIHRNYNGFLNKKFFAIEGGMNLTGGLPQKRLTPVGSTRKGGIRTIWYWKD